MADNDLTAKAGLDTTNFKTGINELNAQIRSIETGFRASAAVMGDWSNTSNGLTSRTDSLSEKLTLQKQKLSTLTDEYKKTVAEQDASSTAAASLANQMYSAEKAIASTENDLRKYGDQLSEVNNESKKTDFSKLHAGLDKVKDGAVAAAKAVGVAMGAIAAAAGAAAVKLGKEVTSMYADNEQLIGGVETLFGKSSKTVENYANNAFKTSGLSANQYMETVTGFSASLLQSLGGDTEKAAKYADTAITDMSDNANKMGSDMSSIQNAYQGFAKQNYTMLDNLKLGYGGTKQEMQRLLDDAQKISGVKYDLSSYADITQAIHVVQTEMGITGTTAKEATETISGSIGGMKSAFQNLLTGLGDPKADIANLTKNLVDGFGNVVKNITPVIQNIVKALPTALESVVGSVTDMLPMLLKTVTDLFTQVLQALLKMIPKLIPAAVDAILTIADALIKNLPLLLSAVVSIVLALVNGLSEQLPTLIPVAVDAIMTIVEGLIDNLPEIIDAAINIVLSLIDGIINALPRLIESVPRIVISIVDGIIKALPKIIDAAPKIITSLIMGIIQALPQIWAAMPQVLLAIVNGIIQVLPMLLTIGPKMLSKIWDGLKSQNWGEIGSNIIKGIADGLSNAWNYIKKAISDIGEKIKSGFTSFFGIHSPSTMMRDTIGKNLALGIGEGFKGNIDNVIRGMQREMPTDMGLSANINGGSQGDTYNSYGPGVMQVTFEIGERKLADAVVPLVSRGLANNSMRRVESI
mgnify:CR=1 FL=1